MRHLAIILTACSALGAAAPVCGQSFNFAAATVAEASAGGPAMPQLIEAAPQQALPAVMPSSAALPRMSPELALATFHRRAQVQSADLASLASVTEIAAQLPDTRQQGTFQLRRNYTAPRELKFTPIQFTGDGFVKTNVINRLLQSEVDHVEKNDPASTAISNQNYKFSYKGVEKIDGVAVHVFQLKPRHKVPGLFKGRVYLDAATGALRRAEGTLVKSPSWFVKKIEFVQDYADVAGFVLPVRTHSSASTRLVGKAVVDITYRDYEARPVPGTEAEVSGLRAAASAASGN
ncbi:MAG TPA: hypothetical protein VFA60_03010 [Terriglobales bacterium]|nr:hypothetical protein [Terriglobales bacterium]